MTTNHAHAQRPSTETETTEVQLTNWRRRDCLCTRLPGNSVWPQYGVVVISEKAPLRMIQCVSIDSVDCRHPRLYTRKPARTRHADVPDHACARLDKCNG